MKPFIVVSDGLDKELFEKLRQFDFLEVHPQSKLTRDELMALAPKINGLVVRSATQVDEGLLKQAMQLNYVVRAGEGIDNIQLKLCKEKNITVANTPGANSLSAAEMAISLMFTLLRHTSSADASMRKGEWEKTAFMGRELSGKTLGILGLGKIGQLVAKRLSGFELRTLFYDPKIECAPFAAPTLEKVQTLKEIFSQSDIITMHLPYMKETHHLINLDLMKSMKKSGILINASRGNIINETDLAIALKEKYFAGAALDVFSSEPLKADSPLRQVPNLLLTPHLGASTEEAQFRVGEMVLNQLKEFFKNKNPLNTL
jgi:D-3-phosphoglycerate dehydrogenase